MSATNTKTVANPLPEMPKNEQKQFYKLCTVQSSSSNETRMVLYITAWLRRRSIPFIVDEGGNIIAQKGDAKFMPAIAAHMDTVHAVSDTEPFKIMWFANSLDGNKTWLAKMGENPAGIGGDDKCGIYAAFKMLTYFDNIKAFFFTKEEVGCVGSGKLKNKHLENVGYMIQLDRWGAKDFISTYLGDDTISDEYKKKADPILQKYGYAHTHGLMTDSINIFSDGGGISCVNVSCGYYEHHTKDEKIDLNEFWNSIKFTKELIETLGNQEYPKFPEPKKYVGGGSYGSTYGGFYGGGYNKHKTTVYNAKTGKYESAPIKTSNSRATSKDKNKNYNPKKHEIGFTAKTIPIKYNDTFMYRINWNMLDIDCFEVVMETEGLTWSDLSEIQYDSEQAKRLVDEYFLISNKNIF